MILIIDLSLELVNDNRIMNIIVSLMISLTPDSLVLGRRTNVWTQLVYFLERQFLGYPNLALLFIPFLVI